MKDNSRGDGIKPVISQTLRLVVWDWPSLVSFELIFKFVILLLSPTVQWCFDKALQKARLPYLTAYNLHKLLNVPESAAIITGLLLALAFSAFFEIAAILTYCDCGLRGEKTNAFKMILTAFRKGLRIFIPWNLPILLLLLVVFPMSGLIFSTGPVSSFNIPEFVRTFFLQDPFRSVGLILFFLLLELLVILCIFALPEFVLHNRNFFSACWESICLLKGKKKKTALFILGFFLLTTAAGFLFVTVMSIVLLIMTKLLSGEPHLFWGMLPVLQGSSEFLVTIFTVTCCFALIMVLYRKNRGEKAEVSSMRRLRFTRLVFYIPAIVLLLGYYSDTMFLNSYYYLDQDHIQIVAHRAGAHLAPENTIAALQATIESGADYAEIDVQQTKDGALIVLHDANFRRTTGVNRYVWEVTLEETREYDAGSGEQIPTLEEMILEARDRIKLMIELKSTGKESHLVESVVDLVYQYEFYEQCCIASMDYGILEKVRELAPEIPTVYITAAAYGNFAQMEAADRISVETSFALSRLKARLDRINKPMYVWTVNSESSMVATMNMKPEGIITDNPYLALYIMETGRRNLFFSRLADRILGPLN